MKIERTLVPGESTGEILDLTSPLSLWGGVDIQTGRIVEAAHPQYGESFVGKLVVLPHGRGSSSSSYVLAEMLRIGTGPAGLILNEPDSILVIGALVANRLYGANCPIVVTTATPETGAWIIKGDELVEAH